MDICVICREHEQDRTYADKRVETKLGASVHEPQLSAVGPAARTGARLRQQHRTTCHTQLRYKTPLGSTSSKNERKYI